ncbi:hypothetical protein D3C81_604080 [compost metagenome]
MIATGVRLDIGGDNSVSWLGFMVHEEGIGKDYPPIRSCIIDDFHIQLFTQIFGKVCFILLHVGQTQAIVGIGEAHVSKSAVTVSGNQMSGIGINDIYICQFRVLRAAKLEADPAATTQLKGAGTKHTCR